MTVAPDIAAVGPPGADIFRSSGIAVVLHQAGGSTLCVSRIPEKPQPSPES